MEDHCDILEANHRAYGRIASVWDGSVAENYDFKFHEECRELFLGYLKGRRILEVGCGLGWDSDCFGREGYDVTATDFQAAFVTLARSRNPRIRVMVMDMTAPHAFEEPFDGIYGFASFLHVPRERSYDTIRRLADLLRSGGELFLHHVGSTLGITGYTQEALLIDGNPAYCFCHSEEEMEEMLANAGFNDIHFHHLASSRKRSELADRLGLVSYQAAAVKV